MQLAIPSIDIMQGNAVRLRQGKRESTEVFGDPFRLAAAYDSLGFGTIHVVDLDAAFGGKCQFGMLRQLAASCKSMEIQWGGGLRSFGLAKEALESGAQRVVFSTAIFESPEEVQRAADGFGKERVVAGLDFSGLPPVARVRGWTKGAGMEVQGAVAMAEECGAGAIVATCVEADGMQRGPDLKLVAMVKNATKLAVIASGGMRNASDALDAAKAGADAVIFGRALYSKDIDLGELSCLQKG